MLRFDHPPPPVKSSALITVWGGAGICIFEASFGGTAPGGGSVQPNVLQFHSGFSDYSGPLIIRATNGNLTGYSFLQALAAP